MRAIFLVAFVAFASSATAETVAGLASVVDGDTIEVRGLRIRLEAIDAIESSQTCTLPDGRTWRCAKDAAFALSNKIGQSPVSCRVSNIDRYRRAVATCYSGKSDLNGWMVRNGWAVAYRQYGNQYVRHEAKARAEKLGIWVSQFVMPWDWRRSKRGG